MRRLDQKCQWSLASRNYEQDRAWQGRAEDETSEERSNIQSDKQIRPLEAGYLVSSDRCRRIGNWSPLSAKVANLREALRSACAWHRHLFQRYRSNNLRSVLKLSSTWPVGAIRFADICRGEKTCERHCCGY